MPPFLAIAACLLGRAVAAGAEHRDVIIQSLRLADPARKNRTVTAKFCLPAGEAGSRWPLYVVGHGFDCKPEDYSYFCAVAATVMVYDLKWAAVDFETWDLAADQAFLAAELPRLASADPSSPFYGRLGGPVVVGGHSMGGGTSVLAAAKHPPIDGVALFAPGLYTIPPAKPYLGAVSVPTLIVSGSDDCGPNQLPKQARPTYDGLASSRKALVVLKGANHCQWAQPTKGEVGVCSLPFFKECSKIDADAQQALGVRLLAAFVDGLRRPGALGAALAAGESNGTWSYIDAGTPGKAIHNDCPCKKAGADEEVLV